MFFFFTSLFSTFSQLHILFSASQLISASFYSRLPPFFSLPLPFSFYSCLSLLLGLQFLSACTHSSCIFFWLCTALVDFSFASTSLLISALFTFNLFLSLYIFLCYPSLLFLSTFFSLDPLINLLWFSQPHIPFQPQALFQLLILRLLLCQSSHSLSNSTSSQNLPISQSFT